MDLLCLRYWLMTFPGGFNSGTRFVNTNLCFQRRNCWGMPMGVIQFSYLISCTLDGWWGHTLLWANGRLTCGEGIFSFAICSPSLNSIAARYDGSQSRGCASSHGALSHPSHSDDHRARYTTRTRIYGFHCSLTRWSAILVPDLSSVYWSRISRTWHFARSYLPSIWTCLRFIRGCWTCTIIICFTRRSAATTVWILDNMWFYLSNTFFEYWNSMHILIGDSVLVPRKTSAKSKGS